MYLDCRYNTNTDKTHKTAQKATASLLSSKINAQRPNGTRLSDSDGLEQAPQARAYRSNFAQNEYQI